MAVAPPNCNSIPIGDSVLLPEQHSTLGAPWWIMRSVHLNGPMPNEYLIRPAVVVGGRLELTKPMGGIWWLGPGDALGFPYWPFMPPIWKGVAHQTLTMDVLPEKAFEELSKSSPELTMHWFNLVSKQISRMEKLAQLRSGVLEPQQLLQVFQSMENQYGRDRQGYLNVRAKVRDWSAYLGLSISTLIRNLDRLEEQGLMERERNRLKIVGG